MDWTDLFARWIPVVYPLVRAVAGAIIEGSKAAGIDHDTVAKTIAKTVLHLSNGVQETRPLQAPPRR